MENDILNILPSYIENIDFRYIKSDNKYIASLIVKDYPQKSFFLSLMESIPRNFSYDISIFLQKQDTMKVLKDLTYYISSSSAEISTINKNQVDIDILNKSNNDAKNLRREIQINNEEVYNVSFFITLYSNSKNEILQILKTFQTKLFSKQIISIISNFRHLDVYLLNIPINDNNNSLLKTNYRNMTTSCVANFFPFYTQNVFDEEGIIFGTTKNDNRLFNLDIFSSKYFNSNMCIFGSSGSGKSFFAKLMIFKQYINGKTQYIFDPEGEYVEFIRKIKGEVFSLNSIDNSYINIMQIFDIDIKIYGNNVMENKVIELVELIKEVANMEREEDIYKLKKAIIKAYKNKGITFDVNSLYKDNNKNNVYIDKVIKDATDFPTILDILNNELSEDINSKLRNIFLTRLKSFSNYTNLDLNNKLILFNTMKQDNTLIKYILGKISIYLKYNSDKIIIYIDEVWRYLNNTTDKNIADVIFMLFKTIRKNNASIVVITQDITDFFAFKEGNYGKSILNNSCFKLFFKIDYLSSEIFKKLGVMEGIEIKDLLKLDKGEAIINFKNNITTLNIKASKYEMNLIEGDDY